GQERRRAGQSAAAGGDAAPGPHRAGHDAAEGRPVPAAARTEPPRRPRRQLGGERPQPDGPPRHPGVGRAPRRTLGADRQRLAGCSQPLHLAAAPRGHPAAGVPAPHRARQRRQHQRRGDAGAGAGGSERARNHLGERGQAVALSRRASSPLPAGDLFSFHFRALGRTMSAVGRPTRRNSMTRFLTAFLAATALALLATFATRAADDKADPTDNIPPKGFIALFNGKDLTNWQGLIDIKQRAKFSPEELVVKQKEASDKILQHWTVKDGVLTYDGMANSLQTVKDFADFELYVDWKIEEKGDSGINLRGCPQVQIWD